jgi:Ser/Thr protein kinase RdoA (MazF antagonist)
MDNKSKELFTESIKQAILHHVGLFESQCEPLNGFESILYKTKLEGEKCVLRISHSLHRSPNQVRGELEYLDYLSKSGLHVPTALPLHSGEALVSISDGQGGAFTAVCFSWAKGRAVWEFETSPWEAPLFEKMGQLTGKMHCLSKSFNFKSRSSQRFHWFEESSLNIRSYLPKEDAAIVQKFDRLNYQIKQVDQNREDYGLIHFDFHQGNFFLQNGEITLFDFDDCQYHLFIADIAIAVFYAIPFEENTAEQVRRIELFFKHFMKGYVQENRLDRKWFSWIPALLKQREIDLYGVMHRSFDLTDRSALDRWSINFLDKRRANILNDRPVVELDWTQLADEVLLTDVAPA